MNYPLISVVVVVRNGEATIRNCVNSLIALDYPRVEIIVVDDGSTDGTGAILAGYEGRIKVISNAASEGPSFARNRAAQEAAGEFIAFTDGDCIAARDWLGQLVACFVDGENVAGAGGSQAVPEDDSTFARTLAGFMSTLGFMTDYLHCAKGISKVEHNPSCNVIYKRESYIRERGFLEGLWPGEDTELDYRLRKKGYELRFNPKAIVYHYRPKDISAFYKAMVRYGWAQAMLVRKYGVFRRIQYVPFFSAAFGVLVVVGLVVNPVSALEAFTGAVALAAAWLSVKAKSLSNGLVYWKLAVILLWAWNLGFVKGLLEKRRI